MAFLNPKGEDNLLLYQQTESNKYVTLTAADDEGTSIGSSNIDNNNTSAETTTRAATSGGSSRSDNAVIPLSPLLLIFP
jgi:hypothetical protein